MSNLERVALLWGHLTAKELEAPYVYPEEIENGEAYFDAELCEIILKLDDKKCRLTLEEIE